MLEKEGTCWYFVGNGGRREEFAGGVLGQGWCYSGLRLDEKLSR